MQGPLNTSPIAEWATLPQYNSLHYVTLHYITSFSPLVFKEVNILVWVLFLTKYPLILKSHGSININNLISYFPVFSCRFAVILAFDVKIEREAQELADSLGVKIFSAEIIYHLFDKFTAYREVYYVAR